ncbi:hypothetical protein [Streptomyces sp. MST-110588]|uniref:hypothetical protein n=1 Tax=Streptomyces sp. MST-110588 TaxID=2833628 RepID=UPI001F5DD3BE|nr:hypothetical protein [Streptomyces sp. MST-110588]UNO40291.1 hypothetical protein KGS77_12760 [Streptomyces sp. MST-110588]
MAEKARRRLRSSTVILGSMGALAAALTSCGSEPDKRCVDKNSYDVVKGYRVLDSKACTSSGSGASSGSGGGSGTSGSSGSYGKAGKGGKTGQTGGGLGKSKPVEGQWYYGSDVKGRYADYGSFSKSAAVERGGFGCSGHSHSSGG